MLGLHLALDFDLRRGGIALLRARFVGHVAGSVRARRALHRHRQRRRDAGMHQWPPHRARDALHGRRSARKTGTRSNSGWRRWYASVGRSPARSCKPVRVRLTHYRGQGTRNSRASSVARWSSARRVTRSCSRAKPRDLRVINADPYLNRLLVEACASRRWRARAARDGVVRGARRECTGAAVAAWQGARHHILPPSSA